MKPTNSVRLNLSLVLAAAGLCVVSGLLLTSTLMPAAAQDAQVAQPDASATAQPAQLPARGRRGGRGGAVQPVIAADAVAAPAANAMAETGTNLDAQAKSDASASGDIALSFQNSPLDMVMQWMMEHTGKTVMKSSSVNAQITVMNSKKVPLREALNMIYRALSLEGYTAVETADSIVIVREGNEPKMNVEVLDSTNNVIPEGRQRLMKRFPLKNAQAADLRERLRPVISDKGIIDIDERSNQLIVTDYNDNLRLINELVGQLDVPSVSDTSIQIFTLKHAESDDLSTLLTMIINAQAPPLNLNTGAGASGGPNPGSGPQITIGPRGGVRIGGPAQPMNPMPDNPSPGAPGGSGTSPASSQQVHVWSDKVSNRLIVSAPAAKMPEIKRLIEDLDSEKPQDVAVRTIPLKNLTAVTLVNEIRNLYQKMSGKSLKDIIEVSANERSNSLIVLSSEANYRALKDLVNALDTDFAQEKIMRTFTLTNADAADVASQLQDLNNSDQNSGGGIRYIYMAGQSPNKMTVVADKRRNSVIVQAPPAQMPGIEKMIHDLDAPITDDSLAPLVYHLKYASASDIEDVLNELFLKKGDTRSYIDVIYGVGDPTSGSSAGRLYGKVRITSEPYSNTIIISSNSKENLDAVMDVMKELDSPPEDGETTIRVSLSYAKASTLAKNLNILFAKGGSPPFNPANQNGQPNGNNNNNQPNTGNNNNNNNNNNSATSGFILEADTTEQGYYPWIGGQPENTRTSDGRSTSLPVSDLVGRVRVVPIDDINAILVSANSHFLPQVIKLVEQMDTSPPSVMIEARVVEVSTDYLDQLGVRWSPDGTSFTSADKDNGFIASSGATYNKGFGGDTSVNNTASGLASTIASLRSGVVNNSISMEFLVQFLHENTHATVLAAPQIHIRNNQMGQLFVGQEVPIQTGSINSGATTASLPVGSSTFSYKNVGVILEVTPHINRTGDISLKIHAESSTVDPGPLVLGQEVFDTRYFKTDLTAKNGQTLVLAGIIQKQINDTIRKTPVLGSIPGLGWAFKKKDKSIQNVELIVFLRPKVVRDEADNADLIQDLNKQAPLVKKWIDDNSNTDNAQPKDKKK